MIRGQPPPKVFRCIYGCWWCDVDSVMWIVIADSVMWVGNVDGIRVLFFSFSLLCSCSCAYLCFCHAIILLAKGRPKLSKKGGLWQCSATFTTLSTSHVLCTIVYIARSGDTGIKGGQFGHEEAIREPTHKQASKQASKQAESLPANKQYTHVQLSLFT